MVGTNVLSTTGDFTLSGGSMIFLWYRPHNNNHRHLMVTLDVCATTKTHFIEGAKQTHVCSQVIVSLSKDLEVAYIKFFPTLSFQYSSLCNDDTRIQRYTVVENPGDGTICFDPLSESGWDLFRSQI